MDVQGRLQLELENVILLGNFYKIIHFYVYDYVFVLFFRDQIPLEYLVEESKEIQVFQSKQKIYPLDQL